MNDLTNIKININRFIAQRSAAGLISPLMMPEFPGREDLLKINGCKLMTSTDRVLPLISGHSIDKVFTITDTLKRQIAVELLIKKPLL